MPPYTPILVFGTVTDSVSNNAALVIVKVTTSISSKEYVTDSAGRYIIDLAGVGYVSGETVIFNTEDKFGNETSQDSVVATGEMIVKNISLAIRAYPKETTTGITNRVMLHNIGNEPVTADNPLPVASSEIDLVNNPSTVWTIVRGDGQPDSEIITIRGVSYKRTFTYTGDNMTARSAWVRL